MYRCKNSFLKSSTHLNLVFDLEMLVGFFSIAVTDYCIKLFEKGGEGMFEKN